MLFLENQLPNLHGVFTKLKLKLYPNRKCQKTNNKDFRLQTHFAWSHHKCSRRVSPTEISNDMSSWLSKLMWQDLADSKKLSVHFFFSRLWFKYMSLWTQATPSRTFTQHDWPTFSQTVVKGFVNSYTHTISPFYWTIIRQNDR